ncbi:MAG: esterase family protein [Lachnospiraceae bacterium]|nr:esterase family protein [Lachnospiraceae bacterium]
MKSRKKLSLLVVAVLLLASISTTAVSHAATKKTDISKKKVSINVNESIKLTISKATGKTKVQWSTNNPKIAKITKKKTKGKNVYAIINGRKVGKAVVTAKIKNGKSVKVKKMTINVKAVNRKNNTTSDKQEETKNPVTPANEEKKTQTPDSNVKPTTTPSDDANNTSSKEDKTTEEGTTTEEGNTGKENTTIDLDNTIYPELSNDASDAVKGTKETITYPSTCIKENETVDIKANVYLPKGYNPSKKYPVIYYCHPIMSNADYCDHYIGCYWTAVGEGLAKEAIVVSANCAAGKESSGMGADEIKNYDNFLNDFKDCLKPYIDEHYPTLTDREHTAIYGFSMGGRVALHLGIALQDTFKYIGAASPWAGVVTGTEDDGFNDIDHVLFETSDFTLEDKYKNNTLIMIFQGTSDNVARTVPTVYHDTLEANGVPHVFLKKEGAGHVDVFTNFVRRVFK